MVTGTADNCLFTNYGFIESYAGKYKIGLDNKNIPSLILNKGFKSGELIETLNAKSPTGENEKILIKFFNEVVSPNPLSSIEYLINDQGLWLSLLIEYLINKKLTNKIKNYSKKYEERLVQIIDLYSEILYIIKSYGGLLNEVDPINLLPIEDYVNQKTFKYMQNNPDDHNTNNMQKLQQKYKSEHLKVSHDNWMVVLYQIVKVFVLNKITINQYQNLPGMNLERRMTESELSSSIYSIPESILLRWLLYHHKKVHGGLIKQAFSFTEHIRNGSVLCHLLLSHVPDLNEDNQPLSNIIDVKTFLILDSKE